MNELKTIKNMPLTKAGIKEWSEALIDSLLSGDYNPLDMEVRLKAMEELIKSIRGDSRVRSYVLDEAHKYQTKTFETDHAEITVKDVPRYDYSLDKTWQDLKDEETDVVNARKARETLLKGLDPDRDNWDRETGEKIMPPAKRSTTVVSIKLR